LFDEAVAAGAPATQAAKWLTGEVTAYLNRGGVDSGALLLDGGALAELIAMTEAGDLSSTAAKSVLEAVLEEGGSPRKTAEALDLIQIRDEGALADAVAAVVAAHPEEIARIAEGDGKLIGFLVGQVMQATGGKADPRRVSELIRESASA
jgi:aspartyl-tRNA(Asn)/glutamyl-tRNA(Gln) amidotransferase subunit B